MTDTPMTPDRLAEYRALIARTTDAGALVASPGVLRELLAEVDRLRAQVAELAALKPARFQDCQVCGAGYEYGKPCSACEFKKWMAAAQEPAPSAACRCNEPDADPYACEADDCTAEFSELNPFGSGARPVNVASAEVSRKCSTCGWATSVWHVDDGSAEEELHRHVAREHGGTP